MDLIHFMKQNFSNIYVSEADKKRGKMIRITVFQMDLLSIFLKWFMDLIHFMKQKFSNILVSEADKKRGKRIRITVFQIDLILYETKFF